MKPTFPLLVTFEDGDRWTLETLDEVAQNMEWFDTEDGDMSVRVVDADGRPVRLLVKACEVLVCEVQQASPAPARVPHTVPVHA